MRPVVVLLERLHPEAESELHRHFAVRTRSAAALSGAHVLITRGLCPITEATLRQAGPTLRCVARVGSGMEHIDVAAATAAGIPVLYTPEAYVQTTAEHALALMLAVARRLPLLQAATRLGQWAARDGLLGWELAGRRLGVVGLGRVGRRLAGLAAVLGMDVVGWSRRSRPPELRLMSLEELLATSDVVSLHLALTPETRGFLGGARIAAMKPGSILINVARGALIDESALVAALRTGQIGGAGLDVLAQEPPGPAHPLLAMPNVLVTPHTAALTERAFREACLLVVRTLIAFVQGAALPSALVCNPQAVAGEGRLQS